MHTKSTREQVINLRRDGYSYTYISAKTGLSKSTLSGWLADVPYTPNNRMRLLLGKARSKAAERKTQIRQEEMARIRADALRMLGKMNKRDILLFGLGLYMGEGSKTNGVVRIVNSDPMVIRVAVAWFLSFGVKREQFSLRIYLYPDSDLDASLHFWSETTRIPKSQFHTPYIDTRTNKKVYKKGKLPHGTLHLSVRSRGRKEFGVLFSRKIQAMNEAVLSKI